MRYSGIHKLDGSSDIIARTGVNLDNYEWNNVMTKADDINVALFRPQAEKGVKQMHQKMNCKCGPTFGQ